MANEQTGGDIRLSLKIGAVFVPVGEKLTSDLGITTNKITLEATYDSGSWTRSLKGQRDGSIPFTMYLRKGSLIYKLVRDAAVLDTDIEVDYEYETVNETFSGKAHLYNFNLSGTGANAVVQVGSELGLQGKPNIVDKPAPAP